MLIRGEKGTAKSAAGSCACRCARRRRSGCRAGRTSHRSHRGPGGRLLDLQKVLRDGEHAFSPGLLSRAHRGVLYVDEVNLLPDHLVDVLLDAAAMGGCTSNVTVCRALPSRFVLIGTMNPEEGELRPQLLDRFGLTVDVAASREIRCAAR